MTNPTEIIAAYDKAIVDAWGPHLARMWPHPMDKVTAHRWLAAGATVELRAHVFKAMLERRRDRSLSIPNCLHYFDNPVRDAIATQQAPVEEDAETLRCRARLAGWRSTGLWPSSWGAVPGEPGYKERNTPVNQILKRSPIFTEWLSHAIPGGHSGVKRVIGAMDYTISWLRMDDKLMRSQAESRKTQMLTSATGRLPEWRLRSETEQR